MEREKLQGWLQNFPGGDAPLVVVPLVDEYGAVLETVDSLLANSAQDVPLLLLDDAGEETRFAETFGEGGLVGTPQNLLYLRSAKPQGLIKLLNRVIEASAPRDLVLVDSATVVPAGWLERLQQAANSRSTAATVTPFSNNGGFLSVPYRNKPMPNLVKGLTAAQVDERLKHASQESFPLIPTALDYCTLYRRPALDVVGLFDESLMLGYGAELDWAQRATAAGFYHVLADNLFVYNQRKRDFQPDEARQHQQKSGQQILEQRYPWYSKALEEAQQAERSPLADALERARAALLGYRVAIDATALDGFTTGAQVLILGLVRALAALPDAPYLAVILRDDVPLKVLQGLDQVVDEVVRVSELESLEKPRYDLIHRPYQVYSADALNLLKKAARRFVVSHLDFINFTNPTYFSRPEDWLTFQELTRATFASANGMMFISQDAAGEAAQQGLLNLPDERVCVSYVGIDHRLKAAPPTPPQEWREFEGQPFLLMVGHNLKHKNRAYALRLFEVLRQKYEWPGHLVFIGPNVVWGGSGGEEALLRLQHPELRSHLHYLGAVSEGEKHWLLQNAALVLYPSIAEGFGFIPFESAAVGTPALSTSTTSLKEVLGEDVRYIEMLDPAADAATAWDLLSNPASASRQIAAIQARSGFFTWDKVAARTLDFYKQIIALPPRQPASSGALLSEKQTHREVQKMQQEYARLETWAGEMSARLTRLERRPLYRLLSRFRLL